MRVPEERDRRDRAQRPDEGGRPDARRLLQALRVEGPARRGGHRRGPGRPARRDGCPPDHKRRRGGVPLDPPPGQPGLRLPARRDRQRALPVRQEGARGGDGGLREAGGHPRGEGRHRRCPAPSSCRGRDDDRRGDDVAHGDRSGSCRRRSSGRPRRVWRRSYRGGPPGPPFGDRRSRHERDDKVAARSGEMVRTHGHACMASAETSRNSFSVAPLAA